MLSVLIKSLRGQLKHIAALEPKGQTFSKTGSSIKEQDFFFNLELLILHFLCCLSVQMER